MSARHTIPKARSSAKLGSESTRAAGPGSGAPGARAPMFARAPAADTSVSAGTATATSTSRCVTPSLPANGRCSRKPRAKTAIGRSRSTQDMGQVTGLRRSMATTSIRQPRSKVAWTQQERRDQEKGEELEGRAEPQPEAGERRAFRIKSASAPHDADQQRHLELPVYQIAHHGGPQERAARQQRQGSGLHAPAERACQEAERVPQEGEVDEQPDGRRGAVRKQRQGNEEGGHGRRVSAWRGQRRDVAADVSPCLHDERLVQRTAVEKRPREAVLLPEVLAVDMGRRE